MPKIKEEKPTDFKVDNKVGVQAEFFSDLYHAQFSNASEFWN